MAGWYPHLFGAQFLPLKRGIFQDLLAAHGEAIDKDALKLALSIHTRSTRYLNAVAQGMKRHDLQGQPVEDMAPEHVHHALLEVFRRRKPQDGEDLTAKLRRRIAQAFEASGLTREAYDALVRGRDEKANALLDEAFAEVAERDAKAEALLRAFEASGQTPRPLPTCTACPLGRLRRCSSGHGSAAHRAPERGARGGDRLLTRRCQQLPRSMEAFATCFQGAPP